ncbi:restriction endonuclease subunit S [Aquirufa antheringensis]
MKRYSKYKSSKFKWMGDIPESWTFTKNRYGFIKSNNGSNTDESTPVLSLTTKGVKIKQNLDFGKSSESYIGHQLVEVGDIVFTPRDFDQTPILSDVSKYFGCISNLYIVDKTKDNVLNHFVNYYWYGLKYSVNYFKNFSHGMRFSFNRFQFDEIPLIIPPLSEQQQIVQFLDEKTELIDRLISTKERKINLLKEQRTSLINQVVTKGLNPNVKMKDSGVEWIGEIPKEWLKSKLKYKCKIIGRIGYRGYTVEDLVNEGQGVITLSPSNIVDGELNLEKRTYLSYEKYYESPEIILEHNDIVYVQRGSSIGKSTIIPINHPEMTINPQLVILKKFNCIPRFIYYFMKSEIVGVQTQNQISGGSTPLITQNSVENFIIVLPKTNQEQQQIVEHLDSKTKEIDDLVQLEQKKIDLLKEYRQSLISEVVTGKIKVTTDE